MINEFMINEQDYNNLKRDFEELKREYYRNRFANTVVQPGTTKLSELTIADGGNITVGTSIGTKIGSSASQKLALFGKTPIVQQTITSQTPATFVANTSTIADDTASWDNYTIGDVVAILRAFGLLA